MRILYVGVVDLDGDRADTIHFTSLARALHARGHELHILALGRQKPAELAGLTVRTVAKASRPRVARLWNDVRLLSSVARLSRRFPFDVLYHRGVPGANRWARLVSLPALVEVNGIHADELQARGARGVRLRWFALRERLTIQGATQVICVTDGLRTQVVQRYGVQPDRCVVIENGTDTDRFQPRPQQACQAQLGLSSEIFHIGFVGAFQPWIDFDTVLRATRRLLDQGLAVELTLIGDGPLHVDVAQRGRELGLGQALRLAGRVPHAMVPTWLNAFDACLAPASGAYVQAIGKSSMKLFEYMACGRPVVASALPGESDIILASQAGLLYNPGDAVSLAAHLARLIHDPALRKQMGGRGRAYVLQHHSWDRVAAQTETAMKAALQHLRT